jgi:hypothetical protein
MNPPQRAKITIELEDGTVAAFVAALSIRQVPNDEWDRVPILDQRWRGAILPPSPRWDLEGSTLGNMTLTIRE